ncbi:MAG TPA: DMT family transporter [Streptosporangiaceae bacterium]|nr:DMT family transporter [Streptosporangiaceae bacterium]
MSGLVAQPAAVLIAFAAAVCFAISNVLQQRVAAKLPTTTAFDGGVLLRLIRRPLWLLGLLAVIVSVVLQGIALGLGRLVVIEPVLASGLLVALALSAWIDRYRMRPVEWAAAVAAFAGLAVFLITAQPTSGQPTATSASLGIASVGALVVAGLAALIAARQASPVRRALVLGVGGGIAAGVTDALTKSVAFQIGGHQLGIVADPRVYLLIVVGLMTYTMQQNGYRAAGLCAFLPAFAVLDPVVGSVLGLTLYHERLDGGPIRMVIEAVAVVAATWGIARLAKSNAASTALPERVVITLPVEPLPIPALVGGQPELGQATHSIEPVPTPFPVVLD